MGERGAPPVDTPGKADKAPPAQKQASAVKAAPQDKRDPRGGSAEPPEARAAPRVEPGELVEPPEERAAPQVEPGELVEPAVPREELEGQEVPREELEGQEVPRAEPEQLAEPPEPQEVLAAKPAPVDRVAPREMAESTYPNRLHTPEIPHAGSTRNLMKTAFSSVAHASVQPRCRLSFGRSNFEIAFRTTEKAPTQVPPLHEPTRHFARES